MQAETVMAILLLIGLLCFVSVNLHNILIVHKRREDKKTRAETEQPQGFLVAIAGIGTLIYFVGILAYLFLVFAGLISSFYALPIYFQFMSSLYLQILGLILNLAGYFIFIWSVISRGKYATSWSMPENQKLVTWGPYKHVRHPSYFGYFLMFLGLFFLWPSWLSLFSLFAVLGYYRVTFEEERFLIQRFGEEYLEYQKRTRRFIPMLL